MGNSMKISAKPRVFYASNLLHEDTALSRPGRGVNTQLSDREYGTHFKSDVNIERVICWRPGRKTVPSLYNNRVLRDWSNYVGLENIYKLLVEACPYPALSVVVVREEVWGGWSPRQGGDSWLCRFNMRLNLAVFCRAVCVPFRFFLHLGQCLLKRLFLCQQWVWNYEDWNLLRATMGWLWGMWICIARNNTGRAAATTAFRATDRIVKVSIDSYLGQQHSVKIISNRLSFEQYSFITVERYLSIKAMGLQWYRSMPVDQFNRFARVSIDTFCSTKQVSKGVDRHLQNATGVKNLLFLARLEFLCKTGCVPQYFQ